MFVGKVLGLTKHRPINNKMDKSSVVYLTNKIYSDEKEQTIASSKNTGTFHLQDTVQRKPKGNKTVCLISFT